MHHVEVKRRMGEADIGALTRLLEAATAADGHRALGEHKWLDLVQGGRAGFAGFIARDADHRGRVIGYAQISRGEDRSWAVEYVVHPLWRSPDHGLREDLAKAALQEIAEQGGGHVHLWVPMPSELDDAVAESLGLRRGRDLHQMRCPLPHAEHSTIATRPFRPGEDEERWLEVNNRAFRGHPEQGVWTMQTIREREEQDWFDAAGFLLHEIDGELAGFCWTKVHDDEQLGEIYVIAVNPDYQGRGLGKQLVLAGLDHLGGAGLPTAMLYVDHDNTEAVGLYKALGFTIDHVDRAYTGDIPAAGR